MKRWMQRVSGLLLAWGASLALAAPLAGQAEQLREQTLGRPYWHVFLAYAITLLLALGWIVSIARRLRRVEDRLQSDAG